MSLLFEKFQGAGNDFVIIDNRSLAFNADDKLISRICNRHFGIGADGLLLVEPSEKHDFSMRYYNADGFEATFCGNGGRCISAWAFNHKISGSHLSFEASDGIHRAWVEEKGKSDFNVILSLNDVRNYDRYDDGYYINTGAQHFVRLVDELKELDVIDEGRRYRYDGRFMPQGTNVNFLRTGPGILEVRTYEKGVEDETLSCGTGVAACALVAMIQSHQSGKWLDVSTHGGVLKVFAVANGNSFEEIKLQGNATRVYVGNIDI
ncbi:MAG: diaminopimelate epimerase [Bacteroidales bacterium]|nr:diaminopimelate epimerase [Bacteroidales bacterium]MDZ4205132.1 diaminopimelate epimerase [Bacteroidales bacterium]